MKKKINVNISKSHIATKFKKSNYEQTKKKHQILTKVKKSNCDKTQKLNWRQDPKRQNL